MKKLIAVLSMVIALGSIGGAGAMMGSGNMVGSGMMSGSGFGMTNSGGFGMTNGMAGAPIVGSDGTAYLISYNPSDNPGVIPASSSFESKITAVTPAGVVTSITLKGIVSRPVIYGDVLVATSSLPDMMNYIVFGNFGITAPSGQSMAYIVDLPLTSASVPIGVSLDGQFASLPVIENNNVYVVTSDFGNSMMAGNGPFTSVYGRYDFDTGTAHSYLYIIGFDGSLVNKITLQ